MAKTKKFKQGKQTRYCEAVIGIDPNSKQPHLLRCPNVAEFLYFKDDSLHCMGAMVCKDCLPRFEKYYEKK